MNGDLDLHTSVDLAALDEARDLVCVIKYQGAPGIFAVAPRRHEQPRA
jgi:hypothetical protein